MRGIEPPYSAWEADVLPLNYIREARQATRPDSVSANTTPAVVFADTDGQAKAAAATSA